MMGMMKEVTVNMIKDKWMKFENNQIDIVQETSNLFIKITLECLFGAEGGDVTVKQMVDG